jgi:bacterial/archaeal transporter family-2 protein
MSELALPNAMALVAGASVVIQQMLNANLRAELNSVVWSGFMSYFLGVLCMVGFAIVRREPIPTVEMIARIPWWAWSGGLFGAIFIGLSILVAHQLGATALIAFLVTGQMIASIVIDQFGWFGLPQKPIDFARLVGVGVLVGGVVLVRR